MYIGRRSDFGIASTRCGREPRNTVRRAERRGAPRLGGNIQRCLAVWVGLMLTSFSIQAQTVGPAAIIPPAADGPYIWPNEFSATSLAPPDGGWLTAVDPPPPVERQPDLARELEEVSRRLAALEAATQQGEAASKKPADGGKKAEPQKAETDWQDLSNEKWTVKLGGHIQMEYVTWANASPTIVGDQNYFEFRRLRLLADGTGYGLYDFRLQMTLEPETVGETQPLGTVSTPDVKDAYLSMNEIPILGRMRIGNFFVPFSLEQVTNDTNNIFVERSIPTQGIFAADREVGVAFYNCTEDKNVTWCYGLFFDNITDSLKERIDDNQGYRVSGRLTWLPFYDEESNGRYLIHTGVGILHTDDHDNRVRFRARPQIHEGPRLIDSGALDADAYTTGNVEGAIVWGPVTVQTEAFLSQVNMNATTVRNVHGAYAHVSWFLTGENRIFERFGQHGAQFSRNVPISNFFIVPGCISPGAWELKARWSLLNLDDVERGQYNDLTVGFNWYWSDRTRVMFDWIHPITTANTTFGATESDLLALRFDFNW